MSKDYYKILNISRSTSLAEIKIAFRQQAHFCHPDKAGGSEAKFKELNEAYQVLGHPQRRAQYDALGASISSDDNFANTGLTWNEFKRRATVERSAEAYGFYDTIVDDVLEGAVGVIDDLIQKIDF